MQGIEAKLPDPAQRQLPLLKRAITIQDPAIANSLPDWALSACSTMSVWGHKSSDGTMRTARNLDYPSNKALMAGMCRFCIFPERDKTGDGSTAEVARLDLGWYGGLGCYTSMNEHGVFVAIHDVAVPKPANAIASAAQGQATHPITA